MELLGNFDGTCHYSASWMASPVYVFSI